jgi:hypothetical protein
MAVVLALGACAQMPIGASNDSPVSSPVLASPDAAADRIAGRDADPLGHTPSPIADAVLLAAGDIAACSKDGDSATAAILKQHPEARVQTLGDNAYDKGTPRQFGCFDDTWGVAFDRLQPALGGHDYMTAGGAGLLRLFRQATCAVRPDGERADDGLVRL